MDSSLRWALAALLVTAGCGLNVPSVERPRVVHPVFDPAEGELPTPNDLALDAVLEEGR